MPAILPRIDPALFGKLKSGDEKAFEHLFREQYAALLAETMLLLDGDGVSAARGIEHVFEEVWKGREEFMSPEALETFLHEAVHEAAARIKSRRAVAHQLGEHERHHTEKKLARPAPGADEAWSKVYGALHVNPTHAAAVAREMALHSRHEAAEQLVELAKPQRTGPLIAIGVLVVIAVGGFIWWTNRGRDITDLTTTLATSNNRTIGTLMAQFSNVSLGDGSTAKLGPDTKLRVPPGFGTSMRGLKLEGTATFSVAPDQQRRLLVRAGNATIAATGTEFTVRSYPDEPDVTLRVSEGSVLAFAGDSVREVAKGGAIVITADGRIHDATASELEQAVGWTDGKMVVADRTLREIIPLAKRWYGLELFVEDTTLLSRKLTLRSDTQSPDNALKSILTSGGLVRVWKGTNMVLQDRGGRTNAKR